ncbi:MAG: SLC13 family permease [Myxococcota bacterium]|nr:SLC13 family permease [Myxococcota bacterium]
MKDELSENQGWTTSRIGFWLGPVMACLVLVPEVESLSEGGQTLAAITVLMATWWMTEAIPIAATALLPLALFPLFGISPAAKVATAYGHDLIWLFFGGFQLAFAIEKCGLHRRMAMGIIALFGTHPSRLILGFMLAVGLLSMWLLNTSTTLMMLPVAMAVAAAFEPEGKGQFGSALMLGLAYGASVGGMGTYLGTAPNGVFRGVAESNGLSIDFGEWMTFAAPLSVLLIIVIWLYLTRVAFNITGMTPLDAASPTSALSAPRAPWTRQEILVGIIFLGAVALWIARRWLVKAFDLPPKFVSDTTIAVSTALVLFLVAPRQQGRRLALLTWADTARTPWHILILFGGGFALAQGFSATGLSLWLGKQLAVATAGWPIPFLILAIVLFMTFLTEVTSNTATATVLLPVIFGLATAASLPPLLLMLPATLAASCAFMLPVATPPNAIVYGSGLVTLPLMAKVGLWVNLLTAVCITAWVLVWGPMAFQCSTVEKAMVGFCHSPPVTSD